MADYSENLEIKKELINQALNKIKVFPGADIVYFLEKSGSGYNIISEHNNSGTNNYLEQITGILNSEPLMNNIGSTFYSNHFHTYTLLNETGLIIITKISDLGSLYLVIIAGEKEPVDLKPFKNM